MIYLLPVQCGNTTICIFYILYINKIILYYYYLLYIYFSYCINCNYMPAMEMWCMLHCSSTWLLMKCMFNEKKTIKGVMTYWMVVGVCVRACWYTHRLRDLLFSVSYFSFPPPTCCGNNVVYRNQLEVMVPPSCFGAPNDLCVGTEVWRCATFEKVYLDAFPTLSFKLLSCVKVSAQTSILFLLDIDTVRMHLDSCFHFTFIIYGQK